MTSNTSSSSLLDEKMAYISLNISMFGGYRRATSEQIIALGGKLPSSQAITEGSIKVFPNEALKDFHTIRRNLFRKLSRRGIHALNSSNVFAVPRGMLPAIEETIRTAESNFATAKATLNADYDVIFSKHLADNKEAEEILLSLKVPRDVAISKMHFAHKTFLIVPLVKEGEDPTKGVKSIVASLAATLFEEVAANFADLADSDTFKKGKAGQKTLRPIREEVEKMKGFIFLDPAVVGAIKLVEHVLSTLPGSGFIEDGLTEKPFTTLRRLVDLMSEPDSLLNAASKIVKGEKVEDVLFPVQAIPAAPEQILEQPKKPKPQPLAAVSLVNQRPQFVQPLKPHSIATRPTLQVKPVSRQPVTSACLF